MKAVNLIPQDAPRLGRSGGGGGRGAYVLLALLAVAVVIAAAAALAGRGLSDKQAELARAERTAQITEAKARSCRPPARRARCARPASTRSRDCWRAASTGRTACARWRGLCPATSP